MQQAGFDCVELHGAHGYLIAQFMSPYVNKRHDRFGGSFLGRMRFVLEIIARIRHKCGRDFPIGVRYSGVEWVDGGRELDETRARPPSCSRNTAWPSSTSAPASSRPPAR